MIEFALFMFVVYGTLGYFLFKTLSTPEWRLDIYKKYGVAKETHRPS